MIIKPIIKGFEFTKEPYADFVSTLPTYTKGAVLHDLGVSSDPTKNIYAYSLGDLKKKPVIFIQGALHGAHEWRGAYIVREFFKMLCDPNLHPHGYKVTEMLSTFSIFGVLCANPYGYENNVRHNANGVDLNRNFDNNWENFSKADGTNYTKGEAYYKGTAPFSEVEAQIMRDKVLELKPVSFLDMHIYGTDFWKFVCADDTDQLQDLAMSISRSSKMTGSLGYSNTMGNVPSSHLWSRKNDGHKGKKCIGVVFEPAGGNTHYEISLTGLNGLFMYCYYLLEWYKRDKTTVYN